MTRGGFLARIAGLFVAPVVGAGLAEGGAEDTPVEEAVGAGSYESLEWQLQSHSGTDTIITVKGSDASSSSSVWINNNDAQWSYTL